MPYEANDAHLGGVEMPSWAKAGSKSAKQYAEQCDAEYILDHNRYFKHLDPRLDALKVIYDPQYDKYDKILIHEGKTNIPHLAFRCLTGITQEFFYLFLFLEIMTQYSGPSFVHYPKYNCANEGTYCSNSCQCKCPP